VSINYWFAHVVDAYLLACAEGRTQQEAVAAAEAAPAPDGLRVLTQKDLRSRGISYSRQHVTRLVAAGNFPRPFSMPTKLDRDPKTRWPLARAKEAE
jgi:hypothetical protein